MPSDTTSDAVHALASVENVSELPLPQLYSLAYGVHRQQDEVLAQAKQRPEMVAKAAAVCRQLVHAVEASALFSSNEDADDIATADLKYLLAPFYLAELLTSSPAPDGPSQRLQLVKDALHCYSAFLLRCHQYGTLGGLAAKLYDREEMQTEAQDANSKRAAKIERFKADKALKAQLAVLEQRRAAGTRGRPDEDGTEQGPTGGADGWDEGEERQLWLTQLQLAALQALGQRSLLQEEAKMVGAVASTGAAGEGSGLGRLGAGEARREMEEQQKQEVLQQLRRIAGDLSTSTALPDRRAQALSQVFRQGHLPPTRTLAQQAELELADARRREQAEQQSRAVEAARVAALGSEEDEVALRAQRDRDDWRDANPKGWGNSKSKPCG
ncbi:hypothetical protein QJQ45_024965 [Haematococcus lacustris]|nr:hypothetical protein QJQ45_024965 [Haematococcus lacustris]